jgi:hypothetical protein
MPDPRRYRREIQFLAGRTILSLIYGVQIATRIRNQDYNRTLECSLTATNKAHGSGGIHAVPAAKLGTSRPCLLQCSRDPSQPSSAVEAHPWRRMPDQDEGFA